MDATLGEGGGQYGNGGESTGVPTGGPSEYGTRKGSCHTCGEEGHFAFECKGKGSSVMKLGATSAQSEPSAYGKGK